VLLHLDMGEKESYAAWQGFLYNLVDRGVTSPILVASDGSPGLKKAIREVYPRTIRQRCKVHKMRNVLAKAPKSAQKILKGEITKVFTAQDKKEALRLAQTLIYRYQDKAYFFRPQHGRIRAIHQLNGHRNAIGKDRLSMEKRTQEKILCMA